MMVVYFTGSTFNQVIRDSVQDVGALLYEPVIDDNQYFHKYIKKNIVGLSGIDVLILDTSVCLDMECELLEALEMVRTMYDRTKLIVFAPYKRAGDKFLTDCLNMGITNIISTDDFNEVKREFVYCLNEGMTYRDAVKYKECQPDKVVVKHAVKRAVNKRMIGMIGTESNIGVTHNALILANYFRKRGFMVAVAESNDSGAFEGIRESYEETLFEEGYFTIGGIDFYPTVDDTRMQKLLSHSYNVVIVDFGVYSQQNKDAFERCEDKLLVTGSKPWEMDAINHIFVWASKDVIGKYTFCFNFTQEKDQEEIRKGMGELKSVYFLKYLEDPFTESNFSGADEIFEDILPEVQKEEKKRFLGTIFKKKEKR